MVNHPRRAKPALSTGVTTAAPRPRTRKPAPAPLVPHNHEAEYAWLRGLLTLRAQMAAGQPWFTTDARGLFSLYQAKLPLAYRQVHNCATCHRFMSRFGGLVTIDEHGRTEPVFWELRSPSPKTYQPALKTLRDRVQMAQVTGVFMSSEPMLGVPVTGAWEHFAVENPKVYVETALTAGQAMAKKREDYRTVKRAMMEFKLDQLKEAERVLAVLPSSEKFLGPVRWLIEQKNNWRDGGIFAANKAWRAIATAPDGYCHPRSSMIGTLLEDIEKGLPFSIVQRNFALKVDPLAYQRPQAPPKAGNIEQAEKLVAKLGVERSFERRFARLEECERIWVPNLRNYANPVGVFGHLKRQPATGMILPPQTLTWAKFRAEVLPGAERIDFHLPAGPHAFYAITGPLHDDAPGLFKWPNPFAWYTHSNKTMPREWKIAPGWQSVTAVVPLPPMWGGNDGPSAKLYPGHMFVLDGCGDTTNVGSAIFPECLKSEFHEIRATVEAHSRSARLHCPDEASACGLVVKPGKPFGYQVRVWREARDTIYLIDRWD